jgi:hypothetical protein
MPSESRDIHELIADLENRFLSGEISKNDFWEKMDTYSCGKGLRNLPRSWTSKIWRIKRQQALEAQQNASSFCSCKKCNKEIKEAPVIQHHRHPRTFKQILKECRSKCLNEAVSRGYEENGHKYFYSLNLCLVCNSNMKFDKARDKWECAECREVKRSGRVVYSRKFYDERIEKKEPWSIEKFKKHFYSYYESESKSLAENEATKIFIMESKAYRELDSRLFPWSIYCRDCAFKEDVKKGRIKKSKRKIVEIKEKNEKPKPRIRRRK